MSTPPSPAPIRVLGIIVLVVGCLVPGVTRADWRWLPGETLHPRALADPREPAATLILDSGGDRIDASLGRPLPIVAGRFGNTGVTVVLEVASYFVLGRNGSFFPLQTFDGLFGLGIESRHGPWHGRLRAYHVSAHKADGDSTLSFPGTTYSREDLDLEAGFQWEDLFAYARVGLPWHAVPQDGGPQVALGLNWNTARRGTVPFCALHFSADAERDWRVGKTVLVGLATGENMRFQVGFRYFNGYSFEGQYRRRPLDQWGLEIRFGS